MYHHPHGQIISVCLTARGNATNTKGAHNIKGFMQSAFHVLQNCKRASQTVDNLGAVSSY